MVKLNLFYKAMQWNDNALGALAYLSQSYQCVSFLRIDRLTIYRSTTSKRTMVTSVLLKTNKYQVLQASIGTR
jgi:hypothetical protein